MITFYDREYTDVFKYINKHFNESFGDKMKVNILKQKKRVHPSFRESMSKGDFITIAFNWFKSTEGHTFWDFRVSHKDFK